MLRPSKQIGLTPWKPAEKLAHFTFHGSNQFSRPVAFPPVVFIDFQSYSMYDDEIADCTCLKCKGAHTRPPRYQSDRRVEESKGLSTPSLVCRIFCLRICDCDRCQPRQESESIHSLVSIERTGAVLGSGRSSCCVPSPQSPRPAMSVCPCRFTDPNQDRVAYCHEH